MAVRDGMVVLGHSLENTSHQIAATLSQSRYQAILSMFDLRYPAPLPPLGQTSREDADPLWPHSCDDDRRLGGLTGVTKQSLLERTSGLVLYRKVIDYCSRQ